MMRSVDLNRLRWGLTAMAIPALIALGQSASPVFWRVSTQADFLLGEVEDVSVDAIGRVLLGPETDVLYETTAPFLWSAAEAAGRLWIGSGNDGKVFLVDADGAGREVFNARELNVHAIAATDDGAAYIGTSPNGAVYRITDDGGTQTVFDPEEQYIWALATGPAETGGARDLYVATGDPGRVYRVTPEGTATLFYDTKATHVLSVAVDPDANLLVSTGSPGRVFRIAPDGRGFVLLDSPYSEIRALRLAPDRSVYAVAVAESGTRTSPSSTRVPPAASGTGSVTVTTSTTVTAVASSTGDTTNSQATASPSSTGASSGSGAVYRIMPDGVWDVVWESSDDAPYDVTVAPANGTPGGGEPAGRTLLIGTGGNGKIFQVLEDPRRVVLLTRAPAQQVTQFVATADGAHYYVTANPGKVYRLSADRVTTGTYVSDVRDAGTVASWGTIRWHAVVPPGATVELSTRTGNTETPDDTWSLWSEPYADPDGAQIASPKARFIQWRAELTAVADSPELLSVTTAYLPRNLRPEITAVVVHEPGIVFQQPFPGTDPPIAGLPEAAEARAARSNGTNGNAQQGTLGRQVYRKGLQTFAWTGRDANQDELLYEVSYRAENDASWHALASELRDSVFTWDTTSAPDGTYLLRIAASDALSNPPALTLTGSRESTPFDIDNSPPELDVESSELRSGQTFLTFTVTDTHSPIHRVEYSLDSERWQVVHPVDGIPDSQAERFELTIATDSRDVLVIRATDAMGNTATAAGV